MGTGYPLRLLLFASLLMITTPRQSEAGGDPCCCQISGRCCASYERARRPWMVTLIESSVISKGDLQAEEVARCLRCAIRHLGILCFYHNGESERRSLILKARLTVDPDGKSITVDDVRTSIRKAEIERCARQRLKNLVFPKTSGNGTKVSCAFDYTPRSSQEPDFVDNPDFMALQDCPSLPEKPDTPLKLEISLEKKIYTPKDKIGLRARFVNPSDEPITVVMPIDGSIVGARSPRYRIRLVRKDGTEIEPRDRRMCGTLNSLMDGDVASVPPHGEIDPFEPLDEYHFRGPVSLSSYLVEPSKPGRSRDYRAKPGRYIVTLTYSYTDPNPIKTRKCVYQHIDLKHSKKKKEELERLRKLHTPPPQKPPVLVRELRSNSVEFIVK